MRNAHPHPQQQPCLMDYMASARGLYRLGKSFPRMLISGSEWDSSSSSNVSHLRNIKKKKKTFGGSKMTQRVRELAVKAEDPSSVPGLHRVGGEN